jgi:hypothetical protein
MTFILKLEKEKEYSIPPLYLLVDATWQSTQVVYYGAKRSPVMPINSLKASVSNMALDTVQAHHKRWL